MIHRERCWVCRGTKRIRGPLYSEACPICVPSPSAGSRITEEEAERIWNSIPAPARTTDESEEGADR